MGKKNPSVILPLSILAHFALQILSFQPSPTLQPWAFPRGTPAAFTLWKVSDCAFTAGSHVAANPGDPPAPACAVASGTGRISWCLQWAGLDGGDGSVARDHFLSAQQQGVWQETLSDPSGAQRNTQGDNMGCRDPES